MYRVVATMKSDSAWKDIDYKIPILDLEVVEWQQRFDQRIEEERAELQVRNDT